MTKTTMNTTQSAKIDGAASRAKLCTGPEKIDMDYYDDALETLPPQRMAIKCKWSAFHFQEHITGEFVRWFVRLGRRDVSYWTLVEACDADINAIVGMCQEAAKKGEQA